jgi:phosphoribosyl-ATP pyrophosphohydrolase
MTGESHIFDELFVSICSKKIADPSNSYTAQLLQRGIPKIAQKVGEEATETIIAAVQGDSAELQKESADLLYHLFVLWAACNITPQQVATVLQQRMGVSGLTEKAGRS